METDLKQVIAERMVTFEDNPTVKFVVRLGMPEFNPETQDYQCTYQILGPGVSINKYAAGLDAFQALQLAFVGIGANLVYVERQTGKTLRWGDSGLGFPRP